MCIWHGIWYCIDYYLLVDSDKASAWTSAVAGVGLCFLLCAGASLVAPPGMFLMDGPCHLPPPLMGTIVTSYRSIAFSVSQLKEVNQFVDPTWLVVADVFVSYVVLPWGVVGFWRGVWLLMDVYLWGAPFAKADLNWSILYSALIAGGLNSFGVVCSSDLRLVCCRCVHITMSPTRPGFPAWLRIWVPIKNDRDGIRRRFE